MAAPNPSQNGEQEEDALSRVRREFSADVQRAKDNLESGLSSITPDVSEDVAAMKQGVEDLRELGQAIGGAFGQMGQNITKNLGLEGAPPPEPELVAPPPLDALQDPPLEPIPPVDDGTGFVFDEMRMQPALQDPPLEPIPPVGPNVTDMAGISGPSLGVAPVPGTLGVGMEDGVVSSAPVPPQRDANAITQRAAEGMGLAEQTAENAAKRAQSIANIERAGLNAIQELQARYKQEMEGFAEQRKRIARDVADFRLDPNRLFSDASTGQLISGAIGVLLGGIGGSLLGRGNSAVDLIQSFIERDLKAQQGNLGKMQEMLRFYSQQGRDAAAAYGLAKADRLDMVAAQIRATAGDFGSEQALIAGQQAALQIEALADKERHEAVVGNWKRGMDATQALRRDAYSKLELGFKARELGLKERAMAAREREVAGIATSAAERSRLSAKFLDGSITPEELERLEMSSKKGGYRDRGINTPSGRIIAASTPEGAKKVRNAQAARSELKELFRQAREVRRTFGPEATAFFEGGAKAESISNQITLLLKELRTMGALDKGAIDVSKGMAPLATTLLKDEAGFMAAMDALEAGVDNTMRQKLKAELMKASQVDQLFFAAEAAEQQKAAEPGTYRDQSGRTIIMGPSR